MKFCEDNSIWRKSICMAAIVIGLALWPVVDHYEHLLESCTQTKLIYLPHPDTIRLEKLKRLDFIAESVLQAGRKEMKKHKLVIVGISRDDAKELQTSIKSIEYIGSFFKDYRVILFENDSEDGSKNIIHSWELANNKVKVITKNYGNHKLPSHNFLAEARNHYLNALEAKEYEDFDLVMVTDMDMAYGVDIRGIEDSFSQINKWDAVCSNGIYNYVGQMYDVFSFRNEEFPWSAKEWNNICDVKNNKDDQWKQACKNGVEYSKQHSYNNQTYSNKIKDKNKLYWLLIAPQMQKIYPVNGELLPVKSCFGGLAFYKRSFTENCRYSSQNDDSEHVAFHQCLEEKHQAKIFMNPKQTIKYSHYRE